jgi:hypothetical protein
MLEFGIGLKNSARSCLRIQLAAADAPFALTSFFPNTILGE